MASASVLPAAQSSFEPLPAPERVPAIDVLRGFAVFGIILADVDILFKITPGIDALLNELHRLFVVDKFWPLFSFLFGLGFAMQITKAGERGHTFLPAYGRRMLTLLLIGVANGLLLVQIWRGEILHRYALLGVLLLLFRKFSPRTLLFAAALCMVIPRAYDAAQAGAQELRLANPETARQAVREQAQREVADRAWEKEGEYIRRNGDYFTLMKRRIEWVTAAHGPRLFTSLRFYLRQLQFPFALFLLGLYVGRRRTFENLAVNLSFVRRVMWWGLAIGLAGQAVWLTSVTLPNPAWPFFTRQIGLLLEPFADAALSFFYAGAVVLLVQRAGWRKLLSLLAWPGRMALTNYLLQSVALAILCPVYALGLSGQMRPGHAWGVAVVIFAFQLLLSSWYLRRFRFGPAEWLWRSLTYGKWQPMRVDPAPRAAGVGG